MKMKGDTDVILMRLFLNHNSSFELEISVKKQNNKQPHNIYNV